MRILVVVDEVKMAGLFKRGLEEEGYAVDVARTAADAVWATAENPYDAIGHARRWQRRTSCSGDC